MSSETLRLAGAIGNGEPKAVTTLVMPVGEALSPSEITGLVANAQTPGEVRKTARSVFSSYCENSLAPIGLVAKVINEGTGYVRYERLPSETADATAGALLDISTLIELSLERLLSKTSAPNKGRVDTELVVRGPHNRIRILSGLVTTQDSLNNKELSETVGVGHRELALHLRDLKGLGIVTYEAVDSTDTDSIFILNPEAPGIKGSFREEMVACLAGRPEGMSRKQLMALMYESRESANYISFRTVFYRNAVALEKAGVIERIGVNDKNRLSDAALTPEWREVISELVQRLVRIESGDTTEISYWAKRGKEIVGTPEILTPLIHKHFDQSKQSQYHRNAGNIANTVLKAFANADSHDYRSLVEALSGTVAARSIKGPLKQLVSQGILTATKDDNGRYVWEKSI